MVEGKMVINANDPSLPKTIIPKAAPSPLFRVNHEPAFQRIAMHIAQFLHPFVLSPHIEIVEASLPNVQRLGS